MKARERKREKLNAKFAEKRKVLKEAGDYETLQKLQIGRASCRERV